VLLLEEKKINRGKKNIKRKKKEEKSTFPKPKSQKHQLKGLHAP
jgi:hypothetical protein